MRTKLATLAPTHLTLEGESHKHGRPPEAETHFRLVIASEAFADDSRIDRHRRVNDLLADELREQVHALSIQAFTPEEWAAKGGQTFATPDCRGGGKIPR